MAWKVVERLMFLQKKIFRFQDKDGFTMPGMLLAMLLSLSLIFSGAEVYKVMSASADIQDVADSACLAAENVPAQYMIVARAIDACILTLSLTSLVLYGAGLVFLLVPFCQSVGSTMINSAYKMMQSRDRLSETSIKALNTFQKALPFMSAACALRVAKANNSHVNNSDYLSIAILVPYQGKELNASKVNGADDLGNDIKSNEDEIKTEANIAEERSAQANEAKKEGFMHDCGLNPSYCMYQRAGSLSSILASQNPLYRSVDTWHFSVALKRAKSYYVHRLNDEQALGNSINEKANSAIRKRFYAYMNEQMNNAYVHETPESFEANFPDIPRNTNQMRDTSLYSELTHPVNINSEGKFCMHAYEQCPNCSNVDHYGSIQEMEMGNYAICARCQFAASSMGVVALASANIDNGFENHYLKVVEAAKKYQKAIEELGPYKSKIKGIIADLFERIKNMIVDAANKRIDAQPPGAYGCVAVVVDKSQMGANKSFENNFIDSDKTLGFRAAISASTIIEENTNEGDAVISNFLSGLSKNAETSGGFADLALQTWLNMLLAYQGGHDYISESLQKIFNSVSLISASGLGNWASDAFSDLIKSLGLAPAKIQSLKPVIVNSQHVTFNALNDEKVDSNSFSARFLNLKSKVMSMPASSSSVFGSLITSSETHAIEKIDELASGKFEVATIEVLGDLGPKIPITISLPASVTQTTKGFVENAMNGLRDLYANVTGVRVWE